MLYLQLLAGEKQLVKKQWRETRQDRTAIASAWCKQRKRKGQRHRIPCPADELPGFPISIQWRSLCTAGKRAPGQPPQRCPVMCSCAFSQPRTISVPNRRRTNHCVRNNKYPVPYPASLLCLNTKVQTRSLCVFTHTPEWTSASFLELVERVGKMVFNKHSLFPKQTHFVMD